MPASEALRNLSDGELVSEYIACSSSLRLLEEEIERLWNRNNKNGADAFSQRIASREHHKRMLVAMEAEIQRRMPPEHRCIACQKPLEEDINATLASLKWTLRCTNRACRLFKEKYRF